jgi:hypothetical protein
MVAACSTKAPSSMTEFDTRAREVAHARVHDLGLVGDARALRGRSSASRIEHAAGRRSCSGFKRFIDFSPAPGLGGRCPRRLSTGPRLKPALGCCGRIRAGDSRAGAAHKVMARGEK